MRAAIGLARSFPGLSKRPHRSDQIGGMALMRSDSIPATVKLDPPEPGGFRWRAGGCAKNPADASTFAPNVVVVVRPGAAGAAEACPFEDQPHSIRGRT